MNRFTLLLSAFILSTASAFAYDNCASIEGRIPFTGHWIFTDGVNFVGGDLPHYGMTPGRFSIGRSARSGEWQGVGRAGRITFSAQGFFPDAQRPYPSYPSGSGRPYGRFGQPGTVNMDGTITLSKAALADVKKALQSGLLQLPGIDAANPDLSQVCVSDMAMNVGRQNGAFGGSLRGGHVYLYLNDTDSMIEMRF